MSKPETITSPLLYIRFFQTNESVRLVTFQGLLPPPPPITVNLPSELIFKVFVSISKEIYGGKYGLKGPIGFGGCVNLKNLSAQNLSFNKISSTAGRGYIITSRCVCVTVGENEVISKIERGLPVKELQVKDDAIVEAVVVSCAVPLNDKSIRS